ncbi:MAG: type II secretion system F family protein, partial [Candidatus Marinimicrobia bacterium]|nr:type II secretion system F family protein [Candidatus Neomarinimicrobiota bacterium]
RRAPAAARLTVRRTRRPRLKMRETLLLTSELSDLLASGMTLGVALNSLARRQSAPAHSRIVGELRDDITQGASLSEALRKWPETFSALYINMVRAGEVSGTLPEVLIRLREHYERVQDAREKVLLALIYPGIVLTMGLGTMIFAMIFVVPRFTAIFEELGSTMPLPTQMLIGASRLLVERGWLMALVIAAGVILLRQALRRPAGRLFWHKAQLRLPIVRQIVSANAYAQFGRTLGALLANGVPVLQALSILEDTLGNQVLAAAVRDARERVTDGASISGPLAQGGVFPPLLTDMLAVGEQSGDMSSALRQIARRYDGEVERSVKIMTTVLEPLLIVVMAALVGFVAISMLLAVFDLTSGLNV